MIEKIMFDVIPAGEDEWELLRHGERRGRTYASKRAAIRAGRELVGSFDEGELVIRDEDGCIEQQRRYRGRPERLRG